MLLTLIHTADISLLSVTYWALVVLCSKYMHHLDCPDLSSYYKCYELSYMSLLGGSSPQSELEETFSLNNRCVA
jgi:hypothetical protein